MRSQPRSDFRSRVARRWWGWLFRRSERRVAAGVEFGVLLPDPAHREILVAKCEAALALLQRHGPRHLARLLAHARGVLIFGAVRPQGEWFRDSRLVVIGEEFAARPATEPAHLAAVIVHEATHAWLEHLGFAYATERRPRLEAICFRTQAAFARAVPGGGPLAAHYEARARAVLAEGVAAWSNDAFRRRAADQLAELGVPPPLARVLARASGDPAA